MKARPSVLDQAIEEGQSSQLAVDAAVLELLPDGARCLSWPGGLQLDNLYEVGDPAEIILLVGLTRQLFHSNSDSREWLLLQGTSAIVLATKDQGEQCCEASCSTDVFSLSWVEMTYLGEHDAGSYLRTTLSE